MFGPCFRWPADRGVDATAGIVGSRTLRSTPESGPRGRYDGAKPKHRAKLYMTADTVVLLVVLRVTPADVDDRTGADRLIEAIWDVPAENVKLSAVNKADPQKGRRPPTWRALKGLNCMSLPSPTSCRKGRWLLAQSV
jgi:hypothetical protein